MLTSLVLAAGAVFAVYLVGAVTNKVSMPADLWAITGLCVWVGSLLFHRPHQTRGTDMRSAIPRTARRSTRGRLTAAAAACALLSAGALLSACTASALAAQPRQAGTTLQAALRRDLSDYLTTRRTAEHISADSLRITFPGTRPAISLADGTTRYDGGPPVSASALWQIGSNTKAFAAVILLQLEAEGKLSIDDPIGTWLPQYPAWRHITIRQLLDMTSRIPNYTSQPAFAAALAANPSARFTTAQLVSYVTGLPLGPAGYHYTNTDYILAQMIIEKVTHDTYASQLTQRIIDPLGLRSTCLAPYTCPPSDAAGMPAGYLYVSRRPAVTARPGRAPARPDLGPGRRRHHQLTGRHDHLGPRPLPRPAPATPPAAPARIPGIRDHRQAHPPHHPRRPGRLRPRRPAGDQPADRHRLGLRGPDLRLPGRAPVLPPLRHDHRARTQQRDQPR